MVLQAEVVAMGAMRGSTVATQANTIITITTRMAVTMEEVVGATPDVLVAITPQTQASSAKRTIPLRTAVTIITTTVARVAAAITTIRAN